MTDFTANLFQQLKTAEKQTAQQKRRAVDWAWYQFMPSPSSPPDTRIHVRGGDLWDVWRGLYDNLCYVRLSSAVADLANPTNVYGTRDFAHDEIYTETQLYQVTFGTAYYYRPFCLLIKPPAVANTAAVMEFVLYDFWTTTEYETAVEAETALEDGLSSSSNSIWYAGYPLCGLVLRNNGTTGIAGAIQPIDRVNRGRSYMWPADCRPVDYTGV